MFVLVGLLVFHLSFASSAECDLEVFPKHTSEVVLDVKETDHYITAAVYIALSPGLLGPQLGIFVLFMSGGRHESSDLVGLGIAVISTMLAVVVRPPLWLLNVFLRGTLRKRYANLNKWTIALAYALTEDSKQISTDVPDNIERIPNNSRLQSPKTRHQHDLS